MPYTYLIPTYVYTPDGIRANMLVAIDEQGQIVSIAEANTYNGPRTEHVYVDLPDTLLLPGFVNAHSHVFQRALRGHTHRSQHSRSTSSPSTEQDTFWTWRHAMYAEAQRLTPESLYSGAYTTYQEMLRAGYTTVGEFHYVHHQPDGKPYPHANAMAEAIISAANDVGIRLVLLMTAYAQSGFNQPPERGQLRFCDASVDAYLQRVDAIRVGGSLAMGLAPHSVRAVPESWFRAIVEYCHTYNLPLHVHADEQVQEIEQCQAAYGCTPIELLDHFGALGPQTTIIHATHANATELALLAKNKCTVCVCPTTEGDLGDGIAPYTEFMAHDILLAIGSDSNTRLDPMEELRWAEYSARMRYQQRRVLVCEKMASPGPLLLHIGTRGGAIALGQPMIGELAAGRAADCIAIDLKHPTMRGWTQEDVLDTLFFGASADAVKAVWVGGKKVV